MANDMTKDGGPALPPLAVQPQMGLPAAVADEEIDIRALIELILAGKWIVLGVAALIVFLGACYVLLVSPTYEADGLVQVEEDQKSGAMSDLGEMSALLLGTPVQTEGEIQILQSRMVLDQVIDKLNLLVSAQPRHFPVIGKAYARWHGDDSIADAPLGLSAYAWGGEKIEVPTLEVPAKLLGERLFLRTGPNGFSVEYPRGNKLLEGAVGQTASIDYLDGRISLFVRDLKARPGTVFTLTRYARQDVQGRLAKKLSISEQGKQSGVIGLKFSGDTPEFVGAVVNNIEDAYLRQNVERRSAEAAQSLDFLERQLPQLKDQVDAAQARLKAYQLEHSSVDVTKETELVLEQSVSLEASRLQIMQQREQALQRFTAQHPTVKALDEQIRGIEAEQGKLKGTVQKLPPTQQEILSLMRDLDVANQLYTALLNTIQQLQVAKAGTVGNVRIVDRALPPLGPSKPKRSLVLVVMALLGTFLGCAAVMLQRALLRGVDDPNEVEARLGLGTYAAIPYSSRQRQLAQSMYRGEPGNYILAARDTGDLAIEALRSLRNSLHFLLLESANNVVMLTGPAPGLGKSFVAVNLGAVLALSGKRVAVVDADLRRGHVHRYSALTPAPGVSDFVAGAASYEQVVRGTAVEGLKLVTNGTTPPNPAELLLHERFTELVCRLSADFDYVFIDTPPALPVADAAVVGRLAGCSLIVLKSAEHPMREIEETYRRLRQAGVKVRGTIFNQVGRRVGSYGYGGYGYSYDRYQRYG